MKRIVLLIGGLLAVSLSAQAGELYRWVDKAGKVHYGDEAPPGAALVEEKKLSDVVSPSSDIPYETRRAQQNFPVTLYVGENCGDLCVQARDLLTKRGIPFTEKNLVTQQEIDAFKAASGGDRVPAISIGKTFVSGFSASRWNGELDIAGYPKSSSYRPLPAQPAPATASQVAPASPPAP